jgi:hypothetical protein
LLGIGLANGQLIGFGAATESEVQEQAALVVKPTFSYLFFPFSFHDDDVGFLLKTTPLTVLSQLVIRLTSNMPSFSGLLFAAVVAVHSFVPAQAHESLTAALPRRSPSHHDIAMRQAANTYETTSPLPLTEYNYPYSAIPEKVNPYAIGRGPQSGYNICNSTTEGADSQCQTMVVNSLVRNDFLVV